LNIARVFADCELFDIYVRNYDPITTIALLNSTITALFSEVESRLSLGLGALKKQVYEVENLPLLNPNAIRNDLLEKLREHFKQLTQNNILSIFDEFGAKDPNEVSLDKVNPQRREVDRVIMYEILGLTEKEQVETYKAVIDLVKTRIEKAKTVARRKKKKGADIEALANGIVDRLNTKIGRFPDAYLTSYKGLWSNEIKIPTGQPTLGSDINGFYVRVRGEEVYRGWNQEEAKFIYFAALTGRLSVRIPLDKQAAASAVKSFEEEYKKLKEEVDKLLLTLIADAKIRKDVEEKVWKKIFQSLR
jgi:hypothetical protein